MSVTLPAATFRLHDQEDLLVSLASQASQLNRERRGATFWVGKDDTTLSLLEQFARSIGEYHQQYTLDRQKKPSLKGVEWWVQCRDAPESILCHYDKDEALWERHRVMRHPTLSTATYLAAGFSAPLVLFSDSFAAVCTPTDGKHVAFDGTLLHGAPAELAPLFSHQHTIADGKRISFLVNLWHDHRPCFVTKFSAPDFFQSSFHDPALELRMNPLTCFRVPLEMQTTTAARQSCFQPDDTHKLLLANRHQRDLLAFQRKAATDGLLVFSR